MQQRLLNFFINYYTYLFFVATLTCTSIILHLYQVHFIDAYINSFMFWNIGIRGVLAFAANWIPACADPIAHSYGWEKGQSFQREIASADGAFGIMGLISPFFSFDFSIATILGFCFCTFFSELSGIKEVTEQKGTEKDHTSSSIRIGMTIDFYLSLVLLSLAIFKIWNNI